MKTIGVRQHEAAHNTRFIIELNRDEYEALAALRVLCGDEHTDHVRPDGWAERRLVDYNLTDWIEVIHHYVKSLQAVRTAVIKPHSIIGMPTDG